MNELEPISGEVLAGDIMLMYHQEFPDEQSVFDLDYFVRQVNDTYAAILRQEYIDAYAILRRDGRHLVEFVSFDSKWLIKEKLEIKKDQESGLYKAKITGEIFSFPFDQHSVGIQQISSVRFGECNLVRSTPELAWKKKYQAETDVTFWWPEQSDIIFDKDCCKEVNVFYVGKGTIMQQGVADLIKDTILNRMFNAKRGGIPDMTNDSNPITQPETEVNKETIK